ncbi:DUF2510 domain-containing protein [Kitasatospora cystarginea]|uniref:DUF2510 domain-containing protein n=1 Tax=Kitasatospora cystarginea TaxID=58350 RepID=A0ABN3DAX4_9ACTN
MATGTVPHVSDSTPAGRNREPDPGAFGGAPEGRWDGGDRAEPAPSSARKSPRSLGGLIVSLVVAVFATAALTGLVWIVADSDGPDDVAALPFLGAAKAGPGRPARDAPPTIMAPDGPASDPVHGWTLPLPAGWTPGRRGRDAAVQLFTAPYSCAAPAGCVRGSFAIGTAPVTGPDAVAVARSAMADTAPVLFGELASHRQLPSGPVAVAGRRGFAERWHVVPKDGVQGYVLVVAVPAHGGGFTVLTGSVDDDPLAPDPAVLDRIVQGIRASSGGVGA